MKLENIKSIEDLENLNDDELQEFMNEGFEKINMLKDDKFNFQDFRNIFDKNIKITKQIEEIKKEYGIEGLFWAIKTINDFIQYYYKHIEIEKEDKENVQ